MDADLELVMHVELAASAPASLPPPDAPLDPLLLLALLADPPLLLLLPPLPLLLDPVPLPEPVPLLLLESLPLLLLDPIPLPEPMPPVLDAPLLTPLLEPPMPPELLLVPAAPLVVFKTSPGSAAQARPRQIVVPRRRAAGAERRCMGKRPKLSASSRARRTRTQAPGGRTGLSRRLWLVCEGSSLFTVPPRAPWRAEGMLRHGRRRTCIR